MGENIDLRLFFTRAPPSGKRPILVRCLGPEHEDDTASLAVYPDGIYCFGCRFQIQNTKKAFSYLQSLGYTEEVMRSSDQPRWREKEGGGYVSASLAQLYHQNLYSTRKERLEWFYQRTLTDQTIHRFLLGHDGTRFVIPVFDSTQRLVTLRFRRDDVYEDEEESKYSGLAGRNKPKLYPEQLQSDQREWRIVTESELCACLLWQHDIPAVTITNGAGQLYKLPDLLEPYSHIHQLFIASDMDRAGDEAWKELLSGQSRFQMNMLQWARGIGKDATELYQNGYGHTIFGKYKKGPGVLPSLLES